MDMKKYKTRTMLNEILGAKDVVRSTKSPWQQLSQSMTVKDFVKIGGQSHKKRIIIESDDELDCNNSTVSPASPTKKTQTFITKEQEIEESEVESEEIEGDEMALELNDDPYKLKSDGRRIKVEDLLEKGFVDIARIHAGGSFGEMALIDGKPRFCTTKCLTRCHIIVIKKDEFEKAKE